MSQENVHFINNLYESFAKGDIPTVLGSFDPNIEWVAAENSPYVGSEPYVGPTAVLENVIMRIGNDWDNFSIRVDELIDAGEKVIMLGYYSGTYKSTGKQILAQVAHLWTLAGGKLVKFQQYTDTKQLMEARESQMVS
jgi:uncharacterized protein